MIMNLFGVVIPHLQPSALFTTRCPIFTTRHPPFTTRHPPFTTKFPIYNQTSPIYYQVPYLQPGRRPYLQLSPLFTTRRLPLATMILTLSVVVVPQLQPSPLFTTRHPPFKTKLAKVRCQKSF